MFWPTYLCTVIAGLILVLIRRIFKKIGRLGIRAVNSVVITARSLAAEDIFIARAKPSILK
jgi:hypothetical protein